VPQSGGGWHGSRRRARALPIKAMATSAPRPTSSPLGRCAAGCCGSSRGRPWSCMPCARTAAAAAAAAVTHVCTPSMAFCRHGRTRAQHHRLAWQCEQLVKRASPTQCISHRSSSSRRSAACTARRPARRRWPRGWPRGPGWSAAHAVEGGRRQAEGGAADRASQQPTRRRQAGGRAEGGGGGYQERYD
jgi:hypothetical protein